MGSSLKDQLLKTGVASKQLTHKIESEQRKRRKQNSKSAAQAGDNGKAQARRVQSGKAARDRELDRQRHEEAERKATAAQIRQLIETNRLSRKDGETPYSFVDGTRVCRIYVPDEIFQQLGRGLLAIVKLDDDYEVVSAQVAGKIGERDASVIIARSQSDQPVEEDDPYADHQVPDDLKW